MEATQFLRHNLNPDGGGMNRGRLEAFSEGVIAILIPIMALETKVPQPRYGEVSSHVELA